MANPYTEDEIAASEAKASRVGEAASKAGNLLNAYNVSPLGQGVTGLVGSSFRQALGWGSGPFLKELLGISTHPSLATSVTTASGWTGILSKVGTWAPLLVGVGGGIEAVNDLRHGQYAKAGIATAKASSMVATVFAEGALLTAGAITALPLFLAEGASLLMTGKGISQHVGDTIAGMLSSSGPTKQVAANVAPYGVPLSQHVVPPTINYFTAPVQQPGNGVLQMMPATGQVASAANMATVADLNQQAIDAAARGTVSAPAGGSWVSRTGGTGASPQSFVGALQSRADAPATVGQGLG